MGEAQARTYLQDRIAEYRKLEQKLCEYDVRELTAGHQHVRGQRTGAGLAGEVAAERIVLETVLTLLDDKREPTMPGPTEEQVQWLRNLVSSKE